MASLPRYSRDAFDAQTFSSPLNAHTKKGAERILRPAPPCLVRRGSLRTGPGAYQEAWKPARAPTSPESKPTPTPPVNTVLSLMR